jgi:predicted nuclease of predicted toxin-antitoxin system
MKFFLDENFPKLAERYLSDLGHEVIDIRSTEHEGLGDYPIFKLCQRYSAIFLTTDRDFFHTIPFHFSEHYGVIVIALSQPNRANIIKKLKWVIEESGIKDYSNKIIILRDKNYSIRK